MGVLADIHASSAYRGLILWIIYFPIACSLVSAIWAGPIAAIEGASFSDAFHWQLQTYTTAALPLTSWGGPTGTAGIILCNITAVFHQIILAIFVGLTAGPVIEPLLGIGAGVCGDSDGSMMVARTFGGFLKKIFLLARKGSATLTSIPTMPKGAAPASTTVEMTGDAAEQRA